MHRAIHWFRYNVGKCSPSRAVYIYNRLALTLGVALNIETTAASNRIWQSESSGSYVMDFTNFFCVNEPRSTVCYSDTFITRGVDLSTLKVEEEEDSPRIGLPRQTPLD